MITPALLFSATALTHNVRRLQQLHAQTGCCWAAALTDMVPLAFVQKIVVPATATASCTTVSDAEFLADAGFGRIVLTGRVVDAESLRRLTKVAAKTTLVAVIDHFRHAELLSQSALQTGSDVNILIEANLGERSTGVRPGPDASLLATAASRLPGLKVTGVFANSDHNGSQAAQSAAAATVASIVTVAEHCLRSVRHVGPTCREIVLAESAGWDLSRLDDRLTCLIASPFAAAECDASEAVDERGFELPSVSLMATVVARPSLEWCVIDAGRTDFGETSILRIAAPLGATVLHSSADSTTLSLLGESRNVRIGDTVRLILRHPERLLVRRRIAVLESSTAGRDHNAHPEP